MGNYRILFFVTGGFRNVSSHPCYPWEVTLPKIILSTSRATICMKTRSHVVSLKSSLLQRLATRVNGEHKVGVSGCHGGGAALAAPLMLACVAVLVLDTLQFQVCHHSDGEIICSWESDPCSRVVFTGQR